MGLRCKRCGSEEHVKNGRMRHKQRYLGKDCGLTFTDPPPRGKPLALKAIAVLLYVRMSTGLLAATSRKVDEGVEWLTEDWPLGDLPEDEVEWE